MILEIIGWTFAGLGMTAVIIIGVDAIRKGLKKKVCPKCGNQKPTGNGWLPICSECKSGTE